MNKRIQKLYDRADKFAKENRTQTISGPGNNYFELFHEKFAELIVKECVNIAFDLGALAGRANKMERCRGCTDAGKLIRQSFGVEE